MSEGVIRHRLHALRTGGDAGITLMELVVAMVLNVIVGTLTVGIFVNVQHSSSTSVDRTVSTASARNAIQDWTAFLRVADGKTAGVKTNRIEWLGSQDMLFYADLYNRSVDNLAVTGAPTMIWLRLDSTGTLIEEKFPSTAAAGATPTACRALAGHVSTPAGPLFTALDSAGAAIANSVLGTPPPASAGCQHLPVTVPSQTRNPNPTVLANLQNVTGVVIDFVVRDTTGAHPIEFTSQAVLPALGGVA
jgi:Tfp pilus assembly protein PilW